MTTPTPTATAAVPAQIKADAADAARQLAAFVSKQTGQSADAIKAFAEEFGPQYAEFAADLAAAKLSGNAAGVARAERDVDELNDVAVLDAAIAAIDAESAGENVGLNVLNRFVNLLVVAALAAA